MTGKYGKILLLSMVAALAAFCFWQWYSAPRIAFVNLPQVFNEFQLKKDLEKKLNVELNTKSKLIDSLKLTLGRMPLKTQTDFEKVSYERQNIIQTANALDIDQQKKTQEFNSQVYERLNRYIKMYANEHRYDFILGAEGSGVLMAADESKDLTKEVITYINQKYEQNQ